MHEKGSSGEFKDLRRQARNQVLVMMSSLILVFLWFTLFSLNFRQETFSADATETATEAAQVPAWSYLPMMFLVSVVFTLCYVLTLRHFISESARESGGSK